MLYGDTPWPSHDVIELINNIYRRPLNFPKNIKISEELKDLIRGCLTIDEEDRLGFDQFYNHKVFRELITV